MKHEIIQQARELLRSRTPLETDCGLLCGGACCQTDEDGQGGVLLFPGEEPLYSRIPWGKLLKTDQGLVLICDGPCDRDLRPLGCRIFPLTPRRGRNGSLGVRIDRRAFAMCPLAGSGTRGLDPRFVEAVLQALRLIDSDPEGRLFLDRWIAGERAFAEATL